MSFDNTVSLILLLARCKPSDEAIEDAVRLIGTGGVDWKAFWTISLRNGVTPLIYKNSTLPGIPDEIRDGLKSAYLHNLREILSASSQLAEVVESFLKEGIDCIPLKGVTTASEVFGDMALYPSVDIDILIRRGDLSRASELLRRMGYEDAYRTDSFYLDHYEDVIFRKGEMKNLELHLRLGNIRYFDIPGDFWWEDALEIGFDGHRFRVLSPEKNLLFLSIHLFGHGYSPLKFIVAIAELLRVYEKSLDWRKLMEDAERYHADKPLLLSVSLAANLLDAPAGDLLRQRLEGLRRVDRLIFRKIQDEVFREDASYPGIMLLLTILQYNSREVVSRLVKWVFPPLKEINYRYNIPFGSKSVYIYYLLNPFLLLLKKRH
jgi:hypothetical protein